MLYIGLANDVYALDASTGQGLWRSTTGTNTGVSCSPVVANGKVYVCSGNNLYAYGVPSSAAAEQESAPPDQTTLRPDFSLKPSQPPA